MARVHKGFGVKLGALLTVSPKEYGAALAVQEKKKSEETSLLQRYSQSVSSNPSFKRTPDGAA